MLKVPLLLLYQDTEVLRNIGHICTTSLRQRSIEPVAARVSVSLAADCNYPYEASRQCPAADE